MSEESPFGEFSSSDAIPAYEPAEEASVVLDEDAPLAMPPPTSSSEGISLPSEADFGLDGGASAEAEPEADPFATVDGGSSANAGAFDSFSNPPEVKEEEAAALKAWEREREVVLRDRAAQAEADKQAALTAAREELNKFYADREAAVSKQAKTNRTDEKNYRADMKTTFESGARWEKVGKLVNTQPKANEKAGQSRVDRMRKLLVQLKTEKK